MIQYRRFLEKILDNALDVFAPKSKTVRALEKMSVVDFVSHAKALQPSKSNTSILFSYNDPLVKTAIWEIKYRHNKKIANLIGCVLYEHLLEDIAEKRQFKSDEKMILIPIPMNWIRRLKRGFNHMELIGQALKDVDTSNIFDYKPSLVKKWRETKKQTGGSRSQRLQNIAGSFKVTDEKSIKGRHVLIIDDVYTTGATTEEIARVIKKSGARSVSILVIAH